MVPCVDRTPTENIRLRVRFKMGRWSTPKRFDRVSGVSLIVIMFEQILFVRM